MKKVIISMVILIALAIPAQLTALYSVLYEGDVFDVQFTYDDNGRALEIVMADADGIEWINLLIVEFEPLEDGYRYMTMNPVGNRIDMTFFGSDEMLMLTTPLEENIFIKKTKSYGYDHRIFK